jgi:AraC-like DNA-binding protein
MPISIQSRLLYQNTSADSPLGRIVLAGRIRNNTGVPRDSMRVLGSYAIVYILEGGGFYQDGNGLARTIAAGDLILLFPDLAHAYGPLPGGLWSEIYIIFAGPVFDLWRRQGLLDPADPVHHVEPIDHWLRRWEQTLFASADSPASPLDQVCRLQLALSDMLISRPRDLLSTEPTWMQSARDLLESTSQSPEEIAQNLGVAYELFRKRFVKFTGMPPAKYRSAKTMTRACQLMNDRRLTTRQISERVGFCDEFHFSRRFKQIVGLSPSDFRKRLPAKKQVG